MLYDETGDCLTPSHASKGGKRYRYYVSRRLVTGKTDDDTGCRLPAGQLERDLVRAVKLHLANCITRGQIGAGDAPSIKRFRAVADALGERCLTLIHQTRLGDGTVRFNLDASKLANTLRVPKASISPEVLSLRLPYTQRRRGVETRLVIGQAQSARDDILIANVARASGWREALCNGDSLSIIATRDGINEQYLGQMFAFAFLSPKLVRAILEGCQPPALTTNWMRRHGLPSSWAEQDRIAAQL